MNLQRSSFNAWSFVFVSLAAFNGPAAAETKNFYTHPQAGVPGGIAGKVDQPLTHALALHRDRLQCFKAALSEGGKVFRFAGLPTGKYDLVLVTLSGGVYEGLALGGEVEKLSGRSGENFQARIKVSDRFFNRARIHRFALIDGGEKGLAFVERIRDDPTLRQSGEALGANLRRLEVIDLEKAADDWTISTSRHIYREEAPLKAGLPFLQHQFVAGLGNIRVIDTVKDLGTVALPAS